MSLKEETTGLAAVSAQGTVGRAHLLLVFGPAWYQDGSVWPPSFSTGYGSYGWPMYIFLHFSEKLLQVVFSQVHTP